MDTKSKNIKYSPFIKALCIIISAAMFALFSVNAVKIVLPLAAFGSDGVLNKNSKPDFYSMDMVQGIFKEKAYYAHSIAVTNENDIKKYYSDIKERTIDAAVKKYLEKRAQVIKNILTSNLEECYELPENDNVVKVSAEFVDSIPDTPIEKQKYPVDYHADYYIQALQKVLNYASGTEFNKYDSLVPKYGFSVDEGIASGEFYYYCNAYNGDDPSVHLYAENYSYDEKEIRARFTEDFDELASQSVSEIISTEDCKEQELAKFQNIRYYVKNGDKVFSNYNYDTQAFDYTVESPVFYSKSGEVSSASDTVEKKDYDKLFEDCDEAVIYCVPENEITGHDEIGMAYFAYKNADFKNDLIISVVFFALAVGAAVCLFNLSGHKNGEEGITLAFIDKLPFDIHTLLSLAVAAGGIGALIVVSEFFSTADSMSILLILYIILTLMWLVFVEWVAGIVRLKKAGLKIYKHCLIYKFLVWIFRKIKKFLSWAKKKIKEIDIKYRPKHLEKRFLLLSIGAILLNVFVFAFCSAVMAPEMFLAGAVFLIVVDVVFIVFAWKYFKNLDKIINAGENGESADFGSEKVPVSLNTLNDIIRVNNTRVKSAVEEAVKNERTKTELITNVSHDLKTPLTSIISYVELLKGEKLNNEQAKQYIEILGEKSNSLKKLIENLVEASKVSAGNVTLNNTVLNLKELVIQAEIEYQAEFESRNLDLRFNENCESVNVFADGTQTYRVLENLLSNAKKYSAQGTRVYSSIRKDGKYGVFEIKNISSEPLDISPQELTERFVRGDASRGQEEGNGLGLSIAKELCALQNGRLEITIDGDLFKAEVYLPLHE